MTLLAALTVLSLFTPFRATTPLAQVRPFDALAFLMLGLAFARGRVFPRGGPPVGLVVLLPYFVWHVLSALGVTVNNGLREALQIATVLAFAWAVSVSLDDFDYRRLGWLLILGMAAVTIYSIGWHIAHGYWTNWKRLIDPKATFTFLPMALACVLITGPRNGRGRLWMMWLALGVAVLFSGERKGLIVFGVLSAALVARGRVLPFVLVTAAAFSLLTFLPDFIDDPYLSRQVRLVANPFESGDYSTALATGEAAAGDSRSNAQRGFAASLARDLIERNLLVGIGTNQYEVLIQQQFTFVPEFLQNGIHGEFLRVLTENGLIGLLAYLMVWGVALVRARIVLGAAVRHGQLSRTQASLLQLTVFVPCLLYAGFEGSGTHSLIVLVTVSIFPDMTGAWLAPAMSVTRQRFRPGPRWSEPLIATIQPGSTT